MSDQSRWQRNIVLFLTSQTLSLFGSSLVQYAIMWYITLTTKSGIMMTVYIVCGFLPSFFLSPFAGVWADRYNRKLLMIAADALIAVATLVMAVLFYYGCEHIWLLFLTAAIRAAGTGIQTPAVGAILPQIVPGDKLIKISGINNSIHAVIMFVSPMVSAFLLTVSKLEFIFFIDVVTAVLAIFVLATLLQVPVHAKALQQQKPSYYKDLKEGFAYINYHRFLKKFFMIFAFMLVFISPASFLAPLQVTRSFGEDVWRLTALEIVFSIGMMVGGVLLASWGGFRNKIHTMTLASFIFGICIVALGLVPFFWLYLIFMGLTGIGMPLFNTPTHVLIQVNVEGDYLGRVFGVASMISTSMMPLGMLVFGPLSDVIRIEWIFIGTGILIFMQGFFLLRSKELLIAGERKALI